MKTTRRIYFVLLALLLSPVAANASPITWDYNGVITDCNAAICSLVPVFVGDPVTGSITIDVGVNDSFTLDNTFMDFSFLVGGVIPIEFPSPDGVFLTGSGTTDANGDFASGSLFGSFVGGTLGGLGGGVAIDLVTGDFLVTVGFGTVFVADVEGAFTRVTSVSEPGTLFLLGLGLIGMAARRRKNA